MAHDDADVEAAVVALAGVGAAADEQVEADAALAQRLELARRRGEEAGRARRAQRRDVAGDEEDGVVAVERRAAPRGRSFGPTVVIVRSPVAVDVRQRAARRAEPLRRAR